MHLDFSVSLGQIAIFISILGVGWNISRKLSFYQIEHELLIKKYCDDLGLDLTDLPTRTRKWKNP